MAYAEHGTNDNPGPMASLPWVTRIADYSAATIGARKVSLGVPFYGRAWGDVAPLGVGTFHVVARSVYDSSSTATTTVNVACSPGYVWDGAKCVFACTPTTCDAMGKNCGTIPDGCYGTLSCGTCSAGYECSASNV